MRHGTTRHPEPRRRRRLWNLLAILALLQILPASRLLADDGRRVYLSDDRLGTRTAHLLLLTRPDVQLDLDLTPEQIQEAHQMLMDLYARAEALRGQPDTLQIVTARRQIDQAQTEWINSRLSLEQQARLMQIDLQWEGPSALLTRPIVAETLSLTDSQRQQLGAAIAERRRLRSQGLTRPEDERQLAEITLSSLTEEQRRRWLALLGRPFLVQHVPARDDAVQSASTRSAGRTP